MRKDVYGNRVWNSGPNTWANSTMLSWLNGDYKNMLDSGVQELMGTTTYYYTPGDGNNTVTTRSDAVFLLSATELGKSHSYANVEGSALPIASTLQIAYYDGVIVSQWTRSPIAVLSPFVYRLDVNGEIGVVECEATQPSRPCFTLPSTTLVDDNNNVV